MIKVIVIISTYNGEKRIAKQLDSIYAQEGVEVSVYIRDDNSNDRTLDILKEYQLHHPQNKLIITKGENLGYAKSFWVALCECPPADYYAFSDQDDIWKPQKLITCIEAFDSDDSIVQLAYCKMQRTDIALNRLPEQVSILRPKDLSKKICLTTTYNYGAATVINNASKELACRIWPDGRELPHDMWVGLLSFWFGKVHYIDDELYYWIRYDTSVTGEGTRRTGIVYRLKKTINKKSYVNISDFLLRYYDDKLSFVDRSFLLLVNKYKTSIGNRLALLFDKEFRRPSIGGTIALKLGILLGWF